MRSWPRISTASAMAAAATRGRGIATGGASVKSSEPSAPTLSACRGRASRVRTAGPRSGRSKALPRYQRLTKRAEALIAAVYLAGTNTRRVKRALFGLFRGAVGKDVVSRAWRKVKVDWTHGAPAARR
jgi:transposase-like protein